MLWNADDPTYMALNLGTALERLAWVRSRQPWQELIFGRRASAAPPTVLDAIRTAPLLLGQGIAPAARGAGSITRKIINAIPPSAAALGLSAAIRECHAYWTLAASLSASWGDIARRLEESLDLTP